MRQVNLQSVEFAKFKLERCAKILLTVQEHLTDQMYYIGIHQDSNQSTLSLPLSRLLGVVKIRLAQINTDIGVIKNQIKAGAAVGSAGAGSSAGAQEDKKKLDRVVATFMDAVTKQIEALANTYNKEMNRYEKSITMLQSALNMLHPECAEHGECLVEIARCKRLLAVNKKHLRGQWRQDALEVDEVSLNRSAIVGAEDGQDRKDMLDAKGLEGEVADLFIDYKQEAVKAFVSILEHNKSSGAAGTQEGEGAKQTTFTQIADTIGATRLENVLATFSLEYAESRGNLNKEQAFFYLALYQYALSRQDLLAAYLKATTEKHPDVQRRRQCARMARDFSSFTSPFLPANHRATSERLRSSSKPLQILHQHFGIEDMKDSLPHSAAYLILQLSDDEQYLFYGFMSISRERRISYHVSKLALAAQDRDALFKMITTLAQNKMTMQKAPITIEEDLINLEKDSNNEITKLLEQLEAFFEPITRDIGAIIEPPVDETEDSNELGTSPPKGGKADPKKDDKKAPAKPPPAKGGKAGGGDAQLAAYESTLPLPASGIESIVLLVDPKLQSLPLESLKMFKVIPVVARDFNLHMHTQRLKALGHQAELHNNKGIAKEELSYIIDPPASMEKEAEDLVKVTIPALNSQATWKGILTSTEHAPSGGEWQERISRSSLFAYFSMTCLLHKFPPNQVADMSIFSKCRAMIIFDRMNSFKTLIDRNVVTSRHFVPSEQPMQEAALFSLSGVNTIITNHWATKPEDNMSIFENLLQGALREQLYLGATVKKSWNELESDAQLEGTPDLASKQARLRNIFRHNTITYGVPIVRIV